MLKPHRFHPLLRAFPNIFHTEHVAKKATHAGAHAHATKRVVEEVKTEKTEVTRSHGRTHVKTEEVEAEVKTEVTKAHGKTHVKTEVDAVAKVRTETTRDSTGHAAHAGHELHASGARLEHGGHAAAHSASAHTENGSHTAHAGGVAHAPVHKTGRHAANDEEVVEVTETLAHVHATTAGVAEVEMTPPHPPREETPQYAKAHHHLTITLDSPCAICGVRNSTLDNPKENPFGAKAIETHHYPIERSLLAACDPKKVSVIFPQVKDRASLEQFIDSEDNLMVLCDVHHRHPLYGVHHLTPQDFFIQPFLLHGYQVATGKEEAEKILARDEAIMRRRKAAKK